MDKREDRKTFTKTNQRSEAPSTEKDADDHENDEWKPSPAQFEKFLARDFELAQSNVRLTMSGSGPQRPMLLRAIKESTLHSVDVITRVLTSQVASGRVTESKGEYSLVP